jgi:hypothetical protein
LPRASRSASSGVETRASIGLPPAGKSRQGEGEKDAGSYHGQHHIDFSA